MAPWHNRALSIGILLILPFIVLNFIVALRLEPLYSFLGSFSAIRNSTFTPLILLLLFPIGAFIAIHPMLQKDIGGKRPIYPANIIFAAATFIAFIILFTALGEEMYRCEILHVPNCD